MNVLIKGIDMPINGKPITVSIYAYVETETLSHNSTTNADSLRRLNDEQLSKVLLPSFPAPIRMSVLIKGVDMSPKGNPITVSIYPEGEPEYSSQTSLTNAQDKGKEDTNG